MNVPHGLAEIQEVYGHITAKNGRIVSPANWTKDNIVLIHNPPFAELPSREIWCHRLVVPDLQAIFQQVIALEHKLKKPLIYSIDGCWVVRVQRGSSDILSCHAFGIAIDINASRNPRGGRSYQSEALVDLFRWRGWEWGNNFPTPDPMHFQRATGY